MDCLLLLLLFWGWVGWGWLPWFPFGSPGVEVGETVTTKLVFQSVVLDIVWGAGSTYHMHPNKLCNLYIYIWIYNILMDIYIYIYLKRSLRARAKHRFTYPPLHLGYFWVGARLLVDLDTRLGGLAPSQDFLFFAVRSARVLVFVF